MRRVRLLIAHCVDAARKRGAYGLDAGEHAVLVVPVGIVELGKVVRVLDVLEREPGVEPPRERQHLLALQPLERLEPIVVLRRPRRLVASSIVRIRTISPFGWAATVQASGGQAPEAVGSGDPDRLDLAAAGDFVFQTRVDRRAACTAAGAEWVVGSRSFTQTNRCSRTPTT